jgi:hypothetical protein
MSKAKEMFEVKTVILFARVASRCIGAPEINLLLCTCTMQGQSTYFSLEK